MELSARGSYFIGGRMLVRCESNQFQLYRKYSVIELTDDSPKLAQMISPTAVMSAGKQATLIQSIFKSTPIQFAEIEILTETRSRDGVFTFCDLGETKTKFGVCKNKNNIKFTTKLKCVKCREISLNIT